MSGARRHSLSRRLTWLFAAIVALVLLALGLLIGSLTERHFRALDAELLGGKVELLRHALQDSASAQGRAALPGRLADALVGHPGLAVLVRDARGRTVFASGQADFPAAWLDAPGDAGAAWTSAQGRHWRGMATTVQPAGAAADAELRVAVATDLAHHASFMRSFLLTLWLAVALAALLAGVLGWLAVRRGLAPLQEMRQRAADITARRLDQRLAVDAIPVELAEVAATLNEMLGRLQASFDRLSDFSSDLAHELRTPVSNLLTQTQVTLARARSAQEYREVLASNAEELERLSRTIADMLFLARADRQLLVPRREPVDLAAEVRGLFEFYEALFEDKGLRRACRGQARLDGDRLMLRRALGNLLSNAIRHTPAGGAIEVELGRGPAADELRVAVRNSGATIDPAHLPRLFDRFYRADAARRQPDEGTGTGLAIVKSIVQAHAGTSA